MKTEEGLLKDKIKAWLAARGYYFHMPVPTGFGVPTLDILACIKGRFVGIETKAPRKKPTVRQANCIEAIRAAGGIAFWCDSFESFLKQIPWI